MPDPHGVKPGAFWRAAVFCGCALGVAVIVFVKLVEAVW